MIHRLHLLLLLAVVMLLAGCDIINTKDDNDDDGALRGSILIGNQGEFGAGNGTITRYEPATNTASTAFRDLETIVQSIVVDGDLLFIAANSGGRVDVMNHQSGAMVGQVEGLVSPRYISITDDKLFVSNLYGSAESFSGGIVSVIDRSTYEHIDDITVGDNPEGIASVGNRVFVANQGFGSGSTISIINAVSHTVEATVDVGCDGPRYVVPDADGDVFVTCTGQTIYDDSFNEIGTTPGAILVLDGTGRVTGRLPVDGRMVSAEFGQDAYFDASGERIFALNERDGAYYVVIVDTQTNTLSGEVGPFSEPIGSVAYDETEGVLYLGRVNGFTQAGSVAAVDLDGELVRTFHAGIAPTSIQFTDQPE